MYLLFPLMLSSGVVLSSPFLTGVAGTALFVLFGIMLGLTTWFVSAGWAFRMDLENHMLHIRDSRQKVDVPLGKLGLLVRNGGFPFPSIWLVLKNADIGTDIPEKGIDGHARSLIESLQKRNPGKKLTVVTIPGGYVHSIPQFVSLLKSFIPPLVVDERLM